MPPRYFLCFIPYLLYSQPAPSTLQQGLEWGINHQYPQALVLFSAVADSFPEHPAGPFFKGAIYQSMMLDMESKQWAPLFYRYMDQAIELAEKKPDDRWFRFYLGAALSYKSYQLARDKKYVAALPTILRSMKELNRLLKQDSSFCDPLLGVGNYLYWRSKAVAWLPFVADQKVQGRTLVQQAVTCAKLSHWAALTSLCWMNIEDKKYSQTVVLCQEGLSRFPDSRFFLWPLAEALFRNRDYGHARLEYQKILTSLAGVQPDNHYNEIVLCWKLAQCAEKLGHYDQVQQLCRRILDLTPDVEVQNRAKDKKEGARRLLIKAEREYKPKL